MATVSLAGRDVTVSNIFCIGRNYAAHVAELGNRPEAEPLVFLKPTSALLAEKSDAYLLCIQPANSKSHDPHGSQGTLGLAWLNMANGELSASEISRRDLSTWIEQIRPSEIIASDKFLPLLQTQIQATDSTFKPVFSPIPNKYCDVAYGTAALLKQLSAPHLANLDAEHLHSALAALGGLLHYAQHTQGQALRHVKH